MNQFYEEEKMIKSVPDENFVIIGRRIDGFFENVAVTCDNAANSLRFKMADTFDGVSLWDKEIKIIYLTPDGYTDFAYPHSIARENGIMTFSWLLNENVSRVAGSVTFAIRISGEDFVWNSLPATFKVSQGIMESGEEVPEYASEWIETLDEKLAGIPGDIEKCKEKTTELDQKIVSHIENTENPHGVTKKDLGLSNVDNTSDLDKPLSVAMQNELNKKAEKNDFEKHGENTDIHITKEERAFWNDKYSKNETDENLSLKESVSNKSSIIDNAINDTTYPSVKAVKTYVDSKTVPLKTGFSNLQNTVAEKADKTDVSEISKDVTELKERIPLFVEDSANKVNEIGENYDDISYPSVAAVKYHSFKFANALKGFASGSVLHLEDVSPVEHKISVFGEVDTEIKCFGKNAFDYKAFVDYCNGNGGSGAQENNVYLGEQCFSYKVAPRDSSLRFLMDGILENTRYTLTMEYAISEYQGNESYEVPPLYIYYTDGTMDRIQPMAYATKFIKYIHTTQAGKTVLGFRIPGFDKTATIYVKKNMQFEYGVASTEPAAYFEPSVHHIAEDGRIDLMSVYPTTMLVANYGDDAATVSAEYNRDINKAFAELENAILSLGGNV